MKICYNQATTMRHSSLKLDLEYCEKYGYDLMEIRIDKLKDYLKDNTLEDLRDWFGSHRIKPLAYNGLECINFRTESDFAGVWDDLVLACRAAETVGGKMLAMDSTFNVGHKTITEIRDETVRVIRRIAQYAEKFGVKLAFEFIGHPQCCVNTYAQAYDIVKATGRDDVGLILDFFHFHAMGSRLEDVAASDVGKIFIVHIDDSEDLPVGALTDDDRLWPGDGAVDSAGLLRTLKAMGYGGAFSLELFRPEYWEMDVGVVVRLGKEKTDAVLAKYFR